MREWVRRRSYDHSSFDEAETRAAKTESIAVILPARDVTQTIPAILDVLLELRGDGWIDELLVVTDREDPAMAIARQRRIEVLDESEPIDGAGPSVGKGDAIWRGLRRVGSEIAVLLDTDTENFDRHFFIGLVAPLLLNRDVLFVKGNFRRPLRMGEVTMEGEGGRVSELVARPLINLFFPALAGVSQPLAGEVALRRNVWRGMHIPAGYGVDIAMLIDAWKTAGLEGLAQVDLGERRDASKPLKDLVPMAHAVITAVIRRVPNARQPASLGLWVPQEKEPTEIRVPVEERPPSPP